MRGSDALYLLLGNAHVICHIGENRGLDEVAFVPPGASTTFQFSPLFLPTLNEVQDFIILVLVNLSQKIIWEGINTN